MFSLRGVVNVFRVCDMTHSFLIHLPQDCICIGCTVHVFSSRDSVDVFSLRGVVHVFSLYEMTSSILHLASPLCVVS